MFDFMSNFFRRKKSIQELIHTTSVLSYDELMEIKKQLPKLKKELAKKIMKDCHNIIEARLVVCLYTTMFENEAKKIIALTDNKLKEYDLIYNTIMEKHRDEMVKSLDKVINIEFLLIDKKKFTNIIDLTEASNYI